MDSGLDASHRPGMTTISQGSIMTRLKAALDPRSVAVIGASENPNKVGGRPVHYLDKFGFKGKIFPINPSRAEVQGHRCYKDRKSTRLNSSHVEISYAVFC